MNIVIIGTGNVGQVLSRVARQVGHQVVQVAGRDSKALRNLVPADMYIVAVTDSAISKLARKIRLSSGIIAHTAGSVPVAALAPCGIPHGVLWPLQSIRANINRIPVIPWVVDGSDEATRDALIAFARTLSGTVAAANDLERRELHLAAVYTSNFMNHLMAQAEGYCAEKGLDVGLLRPLITETVNRTLEAPAAELQTGPAARADHSTLRSHRELLKGHPDMLAIYKLFTRSIGR